MGRKRTNCVYKFYSIDKVTRRYTCLVCHRELKYIHGGNMLKHMMQHKDVYKRVLELNASLKSGENVDSIKMENSETEVTNYERLDPLDMEFLDESSTSEIQRTELEDLHSEESSCKPTDESKPAHSTPRGSEDKEIKYIHKLKAKKTETSCNCNNDSHEVYAKYVASKLQNIAAANNTQRMLAERIINETLFKAEMGLLTL